MKKIEILEDIIQKELSENGFCILSKGFIAMTSSYIKEKTTQPDKLYLNNSKQMKEIDKTDGIFEFLQTLSNSDLTYIFKILIRK